MRTSTIVALTSLCLVQCTKIGNVQKNTFSTNAPYALPAATKVVSGGVAKGILEAGDDDGDAVAFFISEDPAHGTVEITDAVKGEFRYVPEAGYFGADAFSFKVNDGSRDSNAATVDVVVTDGVVSLVSGFATNCALTAKGQVKCWGVNSSGQLGIGSTANRGDEPGELGATLPSVDFGQIGGVSLKATAITAGYFHFCAVLNNGRIKCWGGNGYGALGQGTIELNVGDNPSELGNNLPYVNLGTIDGTPDGAPLTVKMVDSSFYHTCAILQNDRLKCWGYNSAGQLGLGDTANRGYRSIEMGENLPYVDLGTLNGSPYRVKSVKTAAQSTCAILEDDRVKCWGRNMVGELYVGDTTNRGADPVTMGDALPFADPGFAFKAKRLAGRSYSFFALTTEGKLAGWGSNPAGLLGLGIATDVGSAPSHVGVEPRSAYLGGPGAKLDGANKFTMGNAHTCALMDTGNIKCWGGNSYRQLGLGDALSRGSDPTHLTPAMYPDVQLTTGNKIRAIDVSAGEDFTCAVLQDGSVRCWGRNSYGQLGAGDVRTRGGAPAEMGDALLPVPLLE